MLSCLEKFGRNMAAAVTIAAGACATQQIDLESDFVSKGTVACAPVRDGNIEKANDEAILRAREAIAKRIVCNAASGGTRALFDSQSRRVKVNGEQVCVDLRPVGEIVCGE